MTNFEFKTKLLELQQQISSLISQLPELKESPQEVVLEGSQDLQWVDHSCPIKIKVAPQNIKINSFEGEKEVANEGVSRARLQPIPAGF